MLRRTKVAVSFVLVAFSLMTGGASDANADSKLPDPIKAGVAEKLFRLDCGHSLANDESVWTPGENVGRSIEFSSTCWLIKHGPVPQYQQGRINRVDGKNQADNRKVQGDAFHQS
jgi:hypothetical protein